MSADNGIYILKTKDGYRVAHAQAIENIYYHPTCCDNPHIYESEAIDDGFYISYHEKCLNCGQIDPEWERREDINLDTIAKMFKQSYLFDTEEDAMIQADIIYQEITNDDYCGVVEYGIQKINGLEDFDFPTKGTI